MPTTQTSCCYDGACSHVYKFTGKERDAESGLDNFGARFDSSALGRFMTPAWAVRPTAVPYAMFGDPQSLNLYGYVRNDPVSSADLDGHGEPPQNPDVHCGSHEDWCTPHGQDPEQAAHVAQETKQVQAQSIGARFAHTEVDFIKTYVQKFN